MSARVGPTIRHSSEQSVNLQLTVFFASHPDRNTTRIEESIRSSDRLALMTTRADEKKRIESWYLAAARDAGVPIPPGEIRGEEPDFRFQMTNGALGIELTEVLRPASSNHGISPVEEESFHREIIKTAQQNYYAVPDAPPVRVSSYFTNARGNKRVKHELARALSEFVQRNVHRANPIASFAYSDAPYGFDSVVIVAEHAPGDWWSGEVGGIALGDIRTQVEMRIAAKDSLVSTYRSNLPRDAELWLLAYSGVTVSRSMPIPHGTEAWLVPFRFDRVFWFTSLDRQFVEIQRFRSSNSY